MEYKRLTLKNWHDTKFNTFNTKEMKKRLWDFENKIENGTLIELPCKIGDIVYVTYGIEVECWEVTSIQIYGFNMLLRLRHRGTDNYSSQYISELGEHLFLTKEQAEAKLKELQSKE